MLNKEDLLRLQTEQHQHDRRNHSDIICLSKADRLKHYGLHYAKYVGRLARADEKISAERTLTDAVLVCLSAANTLHQRLDASDISDDFGKQVDPLRPFADAAGRFADACEKIDHLEEFLTIARSANAEVLQWVICMSIEKKIDILRLISDRRKELSERQFYIQD